LIPDQHALSPPADLRRANQALVVAATAMLLASFVGTATNIAVPVLEADFPGVGLATISWVVSAFNVTQVTLMLLGGRLADRLGRRRVFLTGMGVFATGAVLSGLAPGIELVIAARVVQAIGVAMILPSSLAAVLPQFPLDRHATVVSLWSSMGIFGAAAAPTVAAGLLAASGWRAVFLVAAPVAVVSLFAGRAVLAVEVRAEDPPPLDLLGTVAGTVAVGGLALTVVQGRAWGWTDPAILAIALSAVAAAAVFVRQSLVHPEPLVDLGLFRIRSFTVVALAGALVATSTSATWFLYPLFLADIWGWTVLQTGLAMTIGPAALIAMAIPAGRFADRRGYRRLLITGALVPTAGTAWMAWQMGPGSSFLVAFLPGTVLIGAGMGLFVGPGNSAALRDVPPAQLGAANAAYNTLRFFGMALGVAVSAAIIGDAEGLDRMPAFRTVWWSMVGTMTLGPVLLWWSYPRDAVRARR
jgi:EmrB/QacA subfamily drug resistance transporter